MISKTSTSLILSVIALLIIFPIISSAQVPKTINYQGYLTDSDGNPVTTPTDTGLLITFSIYDSTNPTAVPLWSQLQPVVVSQGVYNVVLGGGASPQPINLLFDTQYYLGIQIGSDVEMTPRQPLTSVPYALNADNADSAGVSLDLACSNCVSRSEIGFPVGEITSVLASSGLTGGGTTGDISLQVDTSLIQSRIGNACNAGFSIRQINQDGSVVCEQDDGITSETDPTVNTLAKATLNCQNGENVQWNGSSWVCATSAVCSPNDFIFCYSGSPGTLNKGNCKAGIRQCTAGGTFGSCTGEVLPSASEICDSFDNNCDGLTDEGSVCGTRTFAIVSVDSNGILGNSSSSNPVISSNGQYVAFISNASNLVTGDTNGTSDVFLHDRNTNITTRISISTNGTEGNSWSASPSISADGRYIAFQSDATNLVTGDTNGMTDVFLHDSNTNITTRISALSDGTEGNGHSFRPSISGDGRNIMFLSAASNLDLNDTNIFEDIFVHHIATGTTTLISKATNGTVGNNDVSSTSSISHNGQYIAFVSSADNLVSGDTNGNKDIFLHDRNTGSTTRISVASDGTEGNLGSHGAKISGDGRYISLASDASNLVADDLNGVRDVFVHDTQTGIMSRVSLNSSGEEGNRQSLLRTISYDGRYVAFHSEATNFTSNDTNDFTDVFLHDRQTGTTIILSTNVYGIVGNEASMQPDISQDGNYVVFYSSASNLISGDLDGYTHNIFIAQVP